MTPTGKSFRFVRACARSGCQVEFELKSGEGVFPFPFWPAEVSLFPCVAGHVSPPHPPISYPTLVGLMANQNDIKKNM